VHGDDYVAQGNSDKAFKLYKEAMTPELATRERYDVRVEYNVPMQLHDAPSLCLRADVYRPMPKFKGETFPVLLLRTPYNKNFDYVGGRFRAATEQFFFPAFGYIVVVQDVRGRFHSDGEFYPFVNEARDGSDAVEWCATLRGSNGRVGTVGQSYMGFAQLALLTRRPPSLRAMSVVSGFFDHFKNGLYTNGILEYDFAFKYSNMLMRDVAVRQCSSDEAERTRLLKQLESYVERPKWGKALHWAFTKREYGDLAALFSMVYSIDEDILDTRPLLRVGEYLSLSPHDDVINQMLVEDDDGERVMNDGVMPDRLNFFSDFVRYGDRDGEYWQRLFLGGDERRAKASNHDDMLDIVASAAVPTLHIGGWYDTFAETTIELFNAMRGTAPQRLLMTPFCHLLPFSKPTTKGCGDADFGDLARISIHAEQLAWFDRYLKGDAGDVVVDDDKDGDGSGGGSAGGSGSGSGSGHAALSDSGPGGSSDDDDDDDDDDGGSGGGSGSGEQLRPRGKGRFGKRRQQPGKRKKAAAAAAAAATTTTTTTTNASSSGNGGGSGGGASGGHRRCDDPSTARVFVMGEQQNYWLELAEFPPPASATTTKVYIIGCGPEGANGPDGDGWLRVGALGADDGDGSEHDDGVPPTGEGAALRRGSCVGDDEAGGDRWDEYDEYVFSPTRPVPTHGGKHLAAEWHAGVRDQREIERRPDVVSYTSGPLASALFVSGRVVFRLYGSTTGRDTDWVVRLCEVRCSAKKRGGGCKEKQSVNVAEGHMRVRFRKGLDRVALVEKGHVYVFEVDLGHTTYVFAKGNKLRVDVTSSDYPRHTVNPNTGIEHICLETKPKRVVQRVWHTDNRRSALILPLLDTTKLTTVVSPTTLPAPPPLPKQQPRVSSAAADSGSGGGGAASDTARGDSAIVVHRHGIYHTLTSLLGNVAKRWLGRARRINDDR